MKKFILDGRVIVAVISFFVFASCSQISTDQQIELTKIAITQDQKELERISKEFGIAPNWDNIIQTLRCKILSEGRSQKDLELDLQRIQHFESFYGKQAEYKFLGNNIVSKRLGDAILVEFSPSGALDKAWIERAVPQSFDGYILELINCSI